MKKFLLAATMIFFATQTKASVSDLIENVKQNNLPEVINLLNSEDVNAKNEQGNTALHYAVAMDNAQMAEVLLAKGADMNIANEKGWTPLLIAQKKEVPNVIPVLQKALQNMQNTQYIQDRAQAATAESSAVSQQDIIVYHQLLERAKQEIIDARNERDIIMAQNKELEDEVIKLKTELEIANDKIAAQESNKTVADKEDKSETKEKNMAVSQDLSESKLNTSDDDKDAKPQKTPEKKVKIQKTPAKPSVKKTVYQPRYSTLVPQIYAGNEEVVYCLNYLGQSENTYMIKAAGHYAAAVGINEARYNQIVNMSNDFYNLKDAVMRQKRSEECSKIITPADAVRQNQIIRSFNYAIRP